MRITLAMLFCAMLVTVALGQDNQTKRETETQRTISVKSFGESNVLGYLGHPLGTVVRVTGVSVDGDAPGRSKAESGKTLLKIDTVNGKRLEQPVEFPFYHAAPDIKKPHPGERFDYYVYEHGVFDGVVELPRSLGGRRVAIAHNGFHYRRQITIYKSNIVNSNAKAQNKQGKRVAKQFTDPSPAHVERLVMKKGDTFFKDGVEYMDPQAARRIGASAGHLVGLGKQAWPTLFAHLNDERPTTATLSTIGPHQIRHKCYYILRGQITSYPRGYPRSKVSPESQLDGVFKPSLKDWLLKRRNKSLLEIQIETLKHVIALEREAAKRNRSGNQTITKLSAHLGQLHKAVEQGRTKQP